MPGQRVEGDVDKIVFERFFSDVRDGLMVEVGAAGPNFLSIGRLFREKGWRVIGVEPNPAFWNAQKDAGNEVYPYACGPEDREDVDFTVVDSHGAAYEGGAVTFESFSSLGIKPEYQSLKSDLDTRVIKVAMRKLDSVLREAGVRRRRVTLLSVDVEGWEIEVLRGLSFDVYRPRVMILENLTDSGSFARFLEPRGYVRWQRIAPNDIWVVKEAFRTPRLRRGLDFMRRALPKR